MTLTRFLTKYIYIPLGGNRNGTLRTYVNILIVYLVSGMWHGVGFTFIVWGLMHGVATVLYRATKKEYDRIPCVFQWLLTFCFVSIAWVFFRAPDVSSAVNLLKQIVVGGWSFSINAELTETLLMPTLISIPSQVIPFVYVVTALFGGTMICSVCCRNSVQILEKFRPAIFNLALVYFLLVFGMLSLSSVGAFLYTNF